ncbi:FAD-binding protein, partial [Bifidobacterium bifidum]
VLDKSGSAVAGVVAYDTHAGVTHAIHAHNVMFATGGAGRLFHTTSNSWDLTGDGMALALSAGLQLEDIEFVQFHPTGLAHTGILLSEAARAEGGVLRNADGEAFMERYAPEHRDLAARDVVSRSIMAEIDGGRGVADPKDPDGPKDCVWLDMTGIDPDHMNAVLPQVVETIKAYANLDPAKDMVPVKPTAHYTMGGIPITTDGEVYRWAESGSQNGDADSGTRTVVEGLFAAGECSCVSVHGANRLGGNSLLDACLFGTRAGESLAARIAQSPVDDPMRDADADDGPAEAAAVLVDDVARSRRQDVATMLAGRPDADDDAADDTSDGMPQTAELGGSDASAQPGSEEDNPYRLAADLGTLMEHALAVRCDARSISEALNLLDTVIRPRASRLTAHSETPAFNQEITAIWEVRHLTLLAEAMLRASEARHESRGSLQRLDYPARDDERFLAHSMIGMADAADAEASSAPHASILWQSVHINDFPPKTREY